MGSLDFSDTGYFDRLFTSGFFFLFNKGFSTMKKIREVPEMRKPNAVV